MDEQINSTINGKSPLPEAFRGDLSQGSLAVAGGPKIDVELVSLRETMSRMPARDLDKLCKILDSDPALERMRHSLMKRTGLEDISPALAKEVAEEIASHLSPISRPAVAILVDFYFGYLRPFPDITETEPLQSLVGYLKNLPEWDVVLARKDGRTIAACSGQVVDVPCALGNFRIGWNEHTWVDKDERTKGLGAAVAAVFSARAARDGAIGVVIETDNPYLMTTDEAGFNHEDPAARKSFWVDDQGQSMDPFQRFQFWGKQGFSAIVGQDGVSPAPYEQISMDLGEVGSCQTIGLAFQPAKEEYKNGMPKAMYKAALLALQETIDENAGAYPDLVRTMKQIDELAGDTLKLVPLNTPNIDEVLIRARPSKEGATETDIKYCEEKLKDPSISEEVRDILQKTKIYLVSSQAGAE
jgi:GNAT superfamily N-acetyltransferase